MTEWYVEKPKKFSSDASASHIQMCNMLFGARKLKYDMTLHYSVDVNVLMMIIIMMMCMEYSCVVLLAFSLRATFGFISKLNKSYHVKTEYEWRGVETAAKNNKGKNEKRELLSLSIFIKNIWEFYCHVAVFAGVNVEFFSGIANLTWSDVNK